MQTPMPSKSGRTRPPVRANDGASRVSSIPSFFALLLTCQGAVVNGTMYLYGGRAISNSKQTSNTWSMPSLEVALALMPLMRNR